MRTIDAQTGEVYEDGQAFAGNLGAINSNAPSAPAVADALGVPVGWVIMAGVVLIVCGALFNKKRGR